MKTLLHHETRRQFLRERHIQFMHRVGDIVVREWCQACSGPSRLNHFGVVTNIEVNFGHVTLYVWSPCVASKCVDPKARGGIVAAWGVFYSPYFEGRHGPVPKAIRRFRRVLRQNEFWRRVTKKHRKQHELWRSQQPEWRFLL